jgi:hypothetical protein
MREIRSYGSVRGVRSNPYPYRDTPTPGSVGTALNRARAARQRSVRRFVSYPDRRETPGRKKRVRCVVAPSIASLNYRLKSGPSRRSKNDSGCTIKRISPGTAFTRSGDLFDSLADAAELTIPFCITS